MSVAGRGVGRELERYLLRALGFVCVLVAAGQGTAAAQQVVIGKAQFLAGTSGVPTVIDFENLPANTVLPPDAYKARGVTIQQLDGFPIYVGAWKYPEAAMVVPSGTRAISSSWASSQHDPSFATVCNTPPDCVLFWKDSASDHIRFTFDAPVSAAGIHLGQNDVNGVDVTWYDPQGNVILAHHFPGFQPWSDFVGLLSPARPIGSMVVRNPANDGDGIYFDDLIFTPVAPATVAGYTAVRLPTPDGENSGVSGLNGSGSVVGYFYLPGGTSQHAFLFAGGTLRDLGTLGGGYSEATAISDTGKVTGWAVDANGTPHAFLFDGTALRGLGGLVADGPSFGYAVNDRGDVAGRSLTVTGQEHAFLYANGVMTDLGALEESDRSEATGINDAGQVVGTISLGQESHAFLYSAGVMHDIGFGPSSRAVAIAINNRGQVIGTWQDPLSNMERAFIYSADRGFTDLGTLGGDWARAMAINDIGEVTGMSALANHEPHAFKYADGVMTDLGLIPGADSIEGRDINGAGQVVGTAYGGASPLAVVTLGGALRNLNELVVPAGTTTLQRGEFINDAGQIIAVGSDGPYLLTPISIGTSPLTINVPDAIAATEGTPFSVNGWVNAVAGVTVSGLMADLNNDGVFETPVSLNADSSFTFTHVYADNGIFPLVLRATDSTGNQTTKVVTVTVGNVAPSVQPIANQTVTPGLPFTIAGSFTDPGADTWTATIEYGDGTPVQMMPVTGRSFDTTAVPHVYSNAGTYSVTISATDDDGAVGSTQFMVTVQQLPTVTTLAVSPAQVTFGNVVRLTATIAGVPALAPTGTVTFDLDGDSGARSGAVHVSGGGAMLLASSLNVGTHSVRAIYSGDAAYAAGTSATVIFVVAVPPAGQLRTSGVNETGQLGVGNTIASTTLQRVNGLSDVIALAAGAVHGLALRSDGTVWAWGSNWGGQLGTGNTTTSLVPVQVPGLQGITAIAAGEAFSVALRNDRKVLTWGFNGSGELGNGGITLDHRATPQVVDGLPPIVAIANGSNRVLALAADGRVFGWGLNLRGELGTLDVFKVYTPIQLNIANIVAIASGEEHVVFVKADGTVWTSGAGEYGQLGNGTNGVSLQPVQVSNLTDVVAVSAAARHTIALKADGTVWAWGDGSRGELGNGVLGGANVPVRVSTLTNVTAIASTRYRNSGMHNVAVRSDGTLWAWGTNFYGQFGTGTTAESVSTPVRIPVKAVVAAAAGHRFTLSAGAPPEATALQLTAADAPYGSPLTFIATLTAGGSPVSGATISFDVNNDGVLNDGVAVTDTNGTAMQTMSWSDVIALHMAQVGVHGMSARFAGDAVYEGSSAFATYAIRDASPPVVEPIVTGTPGQNGWYVRDVHVSWSVTDAESAATADSSCATTDVRDDTAGLTLTCTATSAGGSTTGAITIKRDANAPAIALSTPPSASVARYPLGERVVANYACTDAVSGPTVCAAPVLSGAPIDTATAGQKTFTVTATDAAGNTGTSTSTFIVEKGKPTLSVRNPVAATVTVGGNPYGVAVNPRTQYVYVTNNGSGTVSVIDGNPSHTTFNTVVATVQGFFAPRGVAVDPITNRIYVSNSGDGGSVSVIDGDPASGTFHSVIARIGVGGWSSHGIAVDSLTNNIYVGNEVAYAWTAIDGRRLTAQGMGQGSACGPYDLALNAKTGRLYITNSWCGGTLVIDVNPASPTFHTRLGQIADGGLATVDVNEITNTVYIADYNATSLSVVDGASNQRTATVSLGGRAYDLAVNPDMKLVYATLGDQQVLAIVDDDPASATYHTVIGTLPVGGGALGVAVDQQTGQVYVTNANDGTVTVFGGTTITYGTPLEAAHVGASSSVPGSFSYDPALGTVLDAGVHRVTATFTPEDAANYEGGTIDSLVAVRRATPAFSNLSVEPIIYGALNSRISGTISAGSVDVSIAVDGTPVSTIWSAADGSFPFTITWPALNAGTHTLTFTFAGNGNYEAASGDTTLIVAKAQPVLTWQGVANQTYGLPLGPDQLKATANVPGTFTYDPPAGTILGAGQHTLTATFTPDDSTNYEGGTVSATFEVFKAPVDVRVSGGTFTYDGQAHEVSVTVTGVRGETLASSILVTYNDPGGGAGVPVAAGRYSAHVSYGGDGNYEPASGSAEIVIDPAPLKVLVDDASRVFGQPNPGFSARYAGFVNGEGTEVLQGALTFTTDAVASSHPGAYTVSASGLSAGNYAITFVPGTLTIAKAALPGGFITGGTFTFDGLPHGAAVKLTGVLGEDLSGAVSVSYVPGGGVPVNAGRYAVTATFAGNADYEAVSDTSATIIIAPASTLTAATAQASAVIGESVPVNIAVQAAGSAVSPDGSVSVFVDGQLAGEAVLQPSLVPVSSAQFAVTGLTLGTHTLTLVYRGTANFVGSSAPALTVTVDRASTAVVLTASPEPSGAGEPVVLAANVTPVAPGAGAPGGSVEFQDNGVVIGSAPVSLVNGSYVATLTTSSMTAGAHTLTVVYGGDANFTGSSASASHTVNSPKASTTTTLQAPASAALDAFVTLDAVVGAASGSADPTGSVEFVADGVVLGSTPLVLSKGATRASLSVSFGTPGARQIVAHYIPDGAMSASSSTPVTVTIYDPADGAPVPTRTDVDAPKRVTFGDAVLVNVTVTPGTPPKKTPLGGTVEIFVDGLRLAQAAVAGQEASVTLTGLARGGHEIVAVFTSNSVDYSGSTSRAAVVTVK